MKKKVYYIIYSIIQLVVGIYTFVCAKEIVANQVEMLKDTFSTLPNQYSDMAVSLFSGNQVIASTRLCAGIAVVFAIVILIFSIKNKLLERRGLTIGLIIASMFLLNDLVFVLAVIALILVLSTKIDRKKKDTSSEKRKIEKLDSLKVTSKDYVWAVMLVFLYCTQFVLPSIIKGIVGAIIFEVSFYILMFIFVFYVFNKRFKRDFKALKKNFGSYLGYMFKWWGIMLGLSFIAALIRLVLGGNVVTANQSNLNSLPLWYVFILSVIWAPIVEEAIFRGVLRRFIKNDRLFIVLSALIFGFLHTIGSEVGLYNMIIQSLQYMVMGGVLGYIYVKSNNIFTNIGVHCIQNFVGVLAMIFTYFV